MTFKKKFFPLFLIFFSFFGNAQSGTSLDATQEDSIYVNKLNQQSKEISAEDPAKGIILATQAKELAEKIGFQKGKAYALKYLGLGYYWQGKYAEAMGRWVESLKVFEQINDQTGVANLLNNMGAVYAEQGDDEKGLEYSLRSLKISEEIKDKLRILSALNTVSSIYNNKKATKDKALGYLLQALPLCEALGDNNALAIVSGNIGEIYFDKDDFAKAVSYYEKSIKALGTSANSSFAYNGIGKVYLKQGDFSKALSYHNKALSIAEKFSNKPGMVGSLEGVANAFIAQNDFNTALTNYNKAIAIAEEIEAKQELKNLYHETALAYSKISDYKNAFKYKTLYADVKDSLYNEATDKKLGSLQFEFDLQKKQGEINLLTKDKALTDQKLQRQKLAKNALMAGLVLVFLIALLIYRNYRIKVRTHKILDKQKGEIEGLLLNILPSEVAKELQEKGHADPRYYDSVSVMFTDFKGFTIIADKMSPQDLIEELNNCFISFDEIIGKHNLEKIKTIGDSYMCAGGIPTPNDQHVENMVRASLEIKDFVIDYNKIRKEKGLEPWDLRIGIHTGPVVAGVVGKKKYAYDIWGSTVNIASRMESNGEAGQVNISSSVYELIKGKYDCRYRGKIYAKNVGEIDMYFLDGKSNGEATDTMLVDSFENDQTGTHTS